MKSPFNKVRITKSYRLDSRIARLIKENGNGTFIEGCVLLCALFRVVKDAQSLSLQLEQKYPDTPIEKLYAFHTVEKNKSRLVKLGLLDTAKQELGKVICKDEDIPPDLPESLKSVLRDFLISFSDEDLDNPL